MANLTTERRTFWRTRIAPPLLVLSIICIATATSQAADDPDKPKRGDEFVVIRETQVDVPGGAKRLIRQAEAGRMLEQRGEQVIVAINGARIQIPLANIALVRSGVARISAEIRKRPNDWMLYLIRASLSRRMKDFDSALKDISAVPNDAPEYAQGLFCRGIIRIDQEQWAEADTDLTAALEQFKGRASKQLVAQVLVYRGAARLRLDTKASLADYEAATKLDPHSAAARLGLAKALDKVGRTADAVELLRKAKDQFSYNRDIRSELTTIYVRLGLLDEAIELANDLLAESPEDVQSLLARAACYLHKNDLARVRQDINRVLDISPKNPEALLLQALMYYAKGELKELNRACHQLTILNFSDPRLLSLRGQLHLVCEMRASAMSDFDKAIELGLQDARTFAFRARARLDYHDLSRAIDDADAAIKLDPRMAEAYVVRGMANHKAGKYESAISDFNRSIAVDGDYGPAYCGRGESFQALKRLREAKADYYTYLHLSSNDDEVSTYSNLCEVLSDLEEYVELTIALSEVLSRRPDDARAAKWYAARGISWSRRGNNVMAVADVTEAILRDPQNATYFSHRAMGLLQLDEFELCLDDLERAEQLGLSDAVTNMTRATVYSFTGHYAQAIDCFESVIAESDSYDAQCHNLLARIYCAAHIDEVRDPKKALHHANLACEMTHWSVHQTIATLAAAHAENGEFELACKSQNQAIDMADDVDRSRLIEVLELYESKQPYRRDLASIVTLRERR